MPFVIYLDAAACFQDVRAALGSCLLVGDGICLGDSPYAMEEDAYFRPATGMLIRVIPEHCHVRPLRSIDFKLESPALRLRQQAPQAAAVTHGEGYAYVLAKFRSERVVAVPDLSAPWQIKRCVRKAYEGPLPDFDAVPIGRAITDVSFFGKPAARGFAVFPLTKAPQIPIVCDCRDVGFGIKLVFVDQGHCSLARLLHLCQVDCPPSFPWSVQGSVYYDQWTRAFHFRRADTVVLGREAGLHDIQDAASRKREVPGGAFDDPRVQHAVKVARRLDFESQVLRSRFPTTYEVSRSNEEVDPPAFESVRPEPIDVQDEEPPESEEHSPVVDEQEELRISVRFLSFQAAPRMWTGWFQRGEGLESLLQRIAILCDTEAHRTRLAPSDVQPRDDVLTILSYPAWWEQVGHSPVLVVPGSDCGGHGDFVQVADRELRAVDMVPAAFFVSGNRLDVYATFDDPPTGGTALFPPDAGACVCFQQEGAPRPRLVSPEERLRGMQHLPAAAVRVHRQPPEEHLVLVLGLRFEQFLVEVTQSHWQSDVARAVGMHSGDVIILEQRSAFDGVAVMGRVPSRVVAVKSARVFDRTLPGFGVFFDGRSAGVPICFRTCFSRRISADDAAVMLDVEVPDGYVATIGHNGCTATERETLQTVSGANYVFWLTFYTDESSSPAQESTGSNDAAGSPRNPDAQRSEGDGDDASMEEDRSLDSGGERVEGRPRSPVDSRAVDDYTAQLPAKVVNACPDRRTVPTPCRRCTLTVRAVAGDAEDLTHTGRAHATGAAVRFPSWMPDFQDDALAQCHRADTSVDEPQAADYIAAVSTDDAQRAVTLLDLAVWD